MLKKWLVLVCLCLILMGVPVVLGACSNLLDSGNAPTYAPNGSVQYPYPLVVSKGKCTVWSVSFGEGDPFCASSLPTQHVGLYVQLSYNGMQQSVCITSIDTRHKVVDVG